MRALTLGLAAFLALTVVLPAAPAAPPAFAAIQPGGPLTELVFPGGIRLPHCTLGFILQDGSGTWYALTAAHCVTAGHRVGLSAAGGAYGTVVVDEDLPSQGGPSDGIDVALIRIDANKVAFVSPAVRGYGGPTGVATPATADEGDPILLTGYNNGLGYGYPLSVNQVQYAQHGGGVLSQWDGPNYRSIDSSVDGYSGGPLVMGDDGQALGLVSALQGHVQVGLPSISVGPSITATLEKLSADYGYVLTLQTAPFSGAPPL